LILFEIIAVERVGDGTGRNFSGTTGKKNHLLVNRPAGHHFLWQFFVLIDNFGWQFLFTFVISCRPRALGSLTARLYKHAFFA